MRHRIFKQGSEQDVFTDLLFNTLLGFAFMFAIAFMLISTPEKAGDIESKAEVLITIRWADKHPDDVDALVEDPQGGLVWYHNRDTGLMHLDRDDRGVFADNITINGVKVSNPINQETVTVRAAQPGEYVVNLLHYKSNYSEPLPVTVKIEKLNPTVSMVYYGTHQLTGSGDEQTAVRFTLDAQGAVASTSQRPKKLITRAIKDKS
ncbi:hypothetical protein N9H90_00965 [Pseudomonadales bacterium]|nr:hypothetical protein [Pseudomonadales bacterium]MDA8702332.1 hypothetical protein [Pseudomonadales bacterium]MDA8952312.1 hypothetical protein [Pseudomonadales bacterium]MDA9905351.1 hypothetical protein [Pseudomonadales bacterium]MDB2647283.1 hypothetical protein [Pseudomonadales bacterium]